MEKTFEINGKTYTAKPITFNAVCDFEDMGLSIEEIFSKQMKGMRVYLAYCGGMDVETAGAEIEAHMMAGKNFSVIYEALVNAVTESGFFHLFQQIQEEEDGADQTEEKTVEVIPAKK